jgi:hypothetical protein
MSQRAPPFRTGPPFIEAFLAQTGSPRTEPPQGRGPLRVPLMPRRVLPG